ncbi:MAG: hypothetical protein INR67_12390, partial [Jatrophihabitans endophyticus]|nr:hypothetical protein [Jatrophihabitans endophyticus]
AQTSAKAATTSTAVAVVALRSMLAMSVLARSVVLPDVTAAADRGQRPQ